MSLFATRPRPPNLRRRLRMCGVRAAAGLCTRRANRRSASGAKRTYAWRVASVSRGARSRRGTAVAPSSLVARSLHEVVTAYRTHVIARRRERARRAVMNLITRLRALARRDEGQE